LAGAQVSVDARSSFPRLTWASIFPVVSFHANSFVLGPDTASQLPDANAESDAGTMGLGRCLTLASLS